MTITPRTGRRLPGCCHRLCRPAHLSMLYFNFESSDPRNRFAPSPGLPNAESIKGHIGQYHPQVPGWGPQLQQHMLYRYLNFLLPCNLSLFHLSYKASKWWLSQQIVKCWTYQNIELWLGEWDSADNQGLKAFFGVSVWEAWIEYQPYRPRGCWAPRHSSNIIHVKIINKTWTESPTPIARRAGIHSRRRGQVHWC